jgi:hypothetical protein
MLACLVANASYRFATAHIADLALVTAETEVDV